MKSLLQEYFGESAKISEVITTKNNDVVLKGLSIRNKGENIAPAIYLEEYYKRYQNGVSIHELMLEIVALRKDRYDVDFGFPIEEFEDFSKIKSHIVYKIINYHQNQKLLKEIPHIPFLDLAVVFYCSVGTSDKRSADKMVGSIQIKNEHLNLWNTDLDTVYQIAKENTPKRLKIKCSCMESILNGFSEEIRNGERNPLEDDFITDPISKDKTLEHSIPMYVITNEFNYLGAAAILYKDSLREVATLLNSDLYILPSSIHECILLPVTVTQNIDELRAMVKDVNEGHVIDEEILSYEVYRYQVVEDEIMLDTKEKDRLS
ncbi:MAG TPA: hypothetical protein IAC41_08640 [Candidatus Merdenecus merdavium]|nr:hypothetical protein [Candidatus Merdenecus merdavium]